MNQWSTIIWYMIDDKKSPHWRSIFDVDRVLQTQYKWIWLSLTNGVINSNLDHHCLLRNTATFAEIDAAYTKQISGYYNVIEILQPRWWWLAVKSRKWILFSEAASMQVDEVAVDDCGWFTGEQNEKRSRKESVGRWWWRETVYSLLKPTIHWIGRL